MVIIALHDQAKDELEDRNASERIDFANALMKASRAELSLATLDTVVFLLRRVIDERQVTHPLDISSMSNLASALGLRFIYANQLEDFVETFSLRRKIIEVYKENQVRNSASVFTCTKRLNIDSLKTQTDVIFQAQNDDNTEGIAKMAMGC